MDERSFFPLWCFSLYVGGVIVGRWMVVPSFLYDSLNIFRDDPSMPIVSVGFEASKQVVFITYNVSCITTPSRLKFLQIFI